LASSIQHTYFRNIHLNNSPSISFFVFHMTAFQDILSSNYFIHFIKICNYKTI
jgi:hypothetical protein